MNLSQNYSHFKHSENAAFYLIISLSMSFFGYLYEQIDFIPNFLIGDIEQISFYWNKFHHITNPAYYHILPAIVTVFCVFYLWSKKNKFTKIQYKSLIFITTLTILTNVLTVVAVTQINNQLYFNDNYSSDFKELAIKWSLINFLRLILIFICIREVFLNFNNEQKINLINSEIKNR